MAMDTEESDPAAPPWSEVASRRLKQRGVQVALVIVVGLLFMTVSGLLLKPKRMATAVTDPKFLFCPKCEHEQRYDSKYDGEACTKCREEPVGKLEGRAESNKLVGKKSPWKWFNVALAIEGVATIAAVVIVLSRKARVSDTTYFVFSCPHCGQRLRFRSVSLGGLGQCKRCKRPVRFPTEEHAVREEDLIREEQERLAAEQDDEDDD